MIDTTPTPRTETAKNKLQSSQILIAARAKIAELQQRLDTQARTIEQFGDVEPEWQRDKERLDWLSARQQTTINRANICGKMYWWIRECTPHNDFPTSLRSAIDAAMKEAK